MAEKYNERVWAGQIISWIKEEVVAGRTIFQDATNDAGLKVASGRTKFPDVLLYADKVSGIIFNGWELKYPDVAADDADMIDNALEKAQRLKSDSFVTWNGTEAIIWKIEGEDYTRENAKRLKTYPKEKEITTRNDLADPVLYKKHEPKLKVRLTNILHDLAQLLRAGTLRKAINISENIIYAVTDAAQHFIPQFTHQINEFKADDKAFRDEFNIWKVNESATLKILASSSRRVETVQPEDVLSKFVYYKTIGKILFYLTLSENLSGRIPALHITTSNGLLPQLESHYNHAKQIDYQAVFESDFTDKIVYNESIEEILFELINVFQQFDFKILPSDVIGNILENLVPKEEKQKFGQYFTSELLANLVTFSALRSRSDVIADPTSGTGTFLNTFYKSLAFYGNRNHQQILNQIWGNDISTFPAILSVINLYKQKVDDIANFPRVIRHDFFSLAPGQNIAIPDNKDTTKINQVPIPHFDAIISNFPFIQQEDIPNEILTTHFRQQFQATQAAFMKGAEFSINERSDYYIYCFYQSLRFLNEDGMLAAITSNAWLGKAYGLQFKKFLLDNFHIKYVVRSTAEHWFKDSKVSTIFITLQRGKDTSPVKFITINKKLEELFAGKGLQDFEDFYTDINTCTLTTNTAWKHDSQYANVYKRRDGSIMVSHVSHTHLIAFLNTHENWATYFISENPLSPFAAKIINPFPAYYDTGRGTRTGWDAMHIISAEQNKTLNIESEFLLPIIKSSRELSHIAHTGNPAYSLFICDKPESELKKKYPNAYRHIKKYEGVNNNTGKLLPRVFNNRQPYWYTLSHEDAANIFISINPDKRLFFSYTPNPSFSNQRLAAIRVDPKEVEIIAALLNSVITLLVVELSGTSRNLGALDLNATFMKTNIRILDPSLLDDRKKKEILLQFKPLSNRTIEPYNIEYTRADRVAFDEAVLKAFGYDSATLPQLYTLLIDTIRNRVELRDR